MQRRTKSLLQEINEVIPPKNKGMVIESRGQHLISTVTNLIDMIYETYDKEIALDIHRRLLISIKNQDPKKFLTGIKRASINENI